MFLKDESRESVWNIYLAVGSDWWGLLEYNFRDVRFVWELNTSGPDPVNCNVIYAELATDRDFR